MKVQDILFDEIAEKNKALLRKLKSEIKEDEWILCLGAGVSIGAGLPNWYGLLARITARLLPLEMQGVSTEAEVDRVYYDSLQNYCEKLPFDKEFLEKFDEAFRGTNKNMFNSINVMEAAEYIQNSLYPLVGMRGEKSGHGGGQKEQRKLHWYMNHLIQEACEIDITVDSDNKALQKSTLGAVAGLMKSDHDELIHNAITYNYDNLLEAYLRNISGCKAEEVHSMVKSDFLKDFGDRTGWNIYHVHGRIPVIDHEKEPMSDHVILTESDYYLEEQMTYSWTNILQSYALVRSRLMFIGFSGTDYNFRRIIKYVSRETCKRHYIFFLVDDIAETVFKSELKPESDIEKCIQEMNEPGDSKYAFEKIFMNYLIHAQTVYWKHYGMDVIWSSRKSLAEDLNSLH